MMLVLRQNPAVGRNSDMLILTAGSDEGSEQALQHSRGKKRGHTFPAALDEEAISHLHDVGLVYGCHLVSVVISCILEGILSHSCTGNPGDDLQHVQQPVTCNVVMQGLRMKIC